MNNINDSNLDKVFKSNRIKSQIQKAGDLLKEYKGDEYTFGVNCLDAIVLSFSCANK